MQHVRTRPQRHTCNHAILRSPARMPTAHNKPDASEREVLRGVLGLDSGPCAQQSQVTSMRVASSAAYAGKNSSAKSARKQVTISQLGASSKRIAYLLKAWGHELRILSSELLPEDADQQGSPGTRCPYGTSMDTRNLRRGGTRHMCLSEIGQRVSVHENELERLAGRWERACRCPRTAW